MDDRAQTPPRFIGDSTWMSRTPLGICVFASSMMRPTAASGSSAAVRKASGRQRWSKLAEWLRPCSPVSRRIGAAG